MKSSPKRFASFRGAIILYALLLMSGRAFSQSRAAADMYRVAIQDLTAPAAADAFTLLDVLDAPLDDNAKQLAAQNAKALEAFDAASGMPFGDWGFNPDDTNYAGKTLSDSRRLCDLVVLRARLRAADGQYAPALDDCYNIANLARRLGVQPSLVRQILQDKLFDQAISTAGLMLMDAPKEQAQRFVQRLDELRSPADPIDVALAQKQAYLWFYRKVVGDSDLRNKLDAAIGSVGEIFGVTRGPANVDDLVADPDVAEQVFADAESAFNQMINALKLPDSDRTQAVENLARKLHSAHPLVRDAAEMVNQSFQLSLNEPMKVELMRAAAKICAELPRPIDEKKAAQLAGSYQYTRVAGGFELLSTIEGLDQPVIIRIGPRPLRERPTTRPSPPAR